MQSKKKEHINETSGNPRGYTRPTPNLLIAHGDCHCRIRAYNNADTTPTTTTTTKAPFLHLLHGRPFLATSRGRGSRACIGLASRREDRNLRHGVARHAVYEEGEYQRNLGHLGTLFAKQNTCFARSWSYSRSINSLRSRP